MSSDTSGARFAEFSPGHRARVMQAVLVTKETSFGARRVLLAASTVLGAGDVFLVFQGGAVADAPG